MENTTYIALSRLDAQQRAMDVVANNIANANTDGFKAERTMFSDYLSQQHGVTAPEGGTALAYTQDRATYLDRTSGSLVATGNPLDVALSGPGYFTVSTPDGPRLTRSGRFGLLADGRLADPAGNPVLDTGGNPIQLSPSDSQIKISGNGTITTENGQVGQLGVVAPNEPGKVIPAGGTLYRALGDTAAVAQPKIMQGATEASNVQPVTELTRMMQTQREFQFVSQFIESESTRQQNAIDKIAQAQS
jgi:flagellar basal-body rod protein FlgF